METNVKEMKLVNLGEFSRQVQVYIKSANHDKVLNDRVVDKSFNLSKQMECSDHACLNARQDFIIANKVMILLDNDEYYVERLQDFYKLLRSKNMDFKGQLNQVMGKVVKRICVDIRTGGMFSILKMGLKEEEEFIYHYKILRTMYFKHLNLLSFVSVNLYLDELVDCLHTFQTLQRLSFSTSKVYDNKTKMKVNKKTRFQLGLIEFKE